MTAVNPPKSAREFAVLDLAGGTGDVACRITRPAAPGQASSCAISIPICLPWVRNARPSAALMTLSPSSKATPKSSLILIAASIRDHSLRNPQRAAYRAGTCASASRAQARRPILVSGIFVGRRAGSRRALRALFVSGDPRIGDAVAGDRDAYQYLVKSIRKFPKPKLFAAMIEASGFRRVSFTPMTGGVVALRSGWRL